MKEELETIFSKCGMSLCMGEDESFHELNVDQRQFQKKLEIYLKSNDEETFFKKLEEYFEDEQHFLVSLLPTKNSLSQLSQLSTHSSNQDSLVKLLFEIDDLRNQLFDYIIGKLLFYCEEDTGSDDRTIIGIQINVPTYILNQFRYQVKIINSEELCTKFIELIHLINSNRVKKELILCLPDIVGDTRHEEIARQLEQLLSDSELLTSILETFRYLKISNEFQKDILGKLLKNYSITAENDLTSLVGYLLKSAISLELNEIIERLREQLKLEDIKCANSRYTLFDCIREYFQISSKLGDIYLNFLASSTDTSLLPVDFFFFTIMFGQKQNEKKLLMVIKNYIKAKKLTAAEIWVFLTEYGTSIINELFENICSIAKSLIICPSSEFSKIASVIYKTSFEVLDFKYKQVVINTLIEHVISSVSLERENALHILYELSSQNKSTSLRPFSIALKSLLDFIDYFNLNQIRKLYFIMCSLGYNAESMESTQASTSVILDTLHIMINKQLSSNQLKYKQMGIMGMLMMIKSISNNNQNVKELKTTIKNELNNIWCMIMECSAETSPESLCLFEDNLTSLIKSDQIIPQIELVIKENLKAVIKSLFQVNEAQVNEIRQNTQSKLTYEFGLESLAKGVLNLFTILKNNQKNRNFSRLFDNKDSSNELIVSPVLIASTFRLMVALERKNVGDLVDYLGIPVFCMSMSEMKKLKESNGLNHFLSFYSEDEQKLILDSIFYLINWFTELINAFCTQSNRALSETLNNKLLSRLKTIIELREILKCLLAKVKFYKPPIAIFGLEDDVQYTNLIYGKKSISGASKKGAKKKGEKQLFIKPSKKSKNITLDSQDKISDIDDDTSKIDEESNEIIIESDIDLSKISLCFREFDIDLINLVNFPLDDIDENILLFVLNEVNDKISYFIKHNSDTQTLSFLHQESKQTKLDLYKQLNQVNLDNLIDNIINNSLNSILNHLNTIYKHFKSVQEENDGIMDCADIMNNQKNRKLLKCFNELLKFFFNIIKYLDLSKKAENKNLISEVISRISKLNPLEEDDNRQVQVELSCLKYLIKLKEVILDLNSAYYLVCIIDLMVNKLFDFNGNGKNDYSKVLANICLEILKTDFGELSSDKKLNNEAVCKILKILFSNAKNSLDLVENFARIITGDEFLSCRDNYENFPTLRLCFSSYFKCLLEDTVSKVKCMAPINTKNPQLNIDRLPDSIDTIKRVTQIHCSLITISKGMRKLVKDVNALTLAKNGKLFIELFTRISMPWLDQAFDQSKDSIIETLRLVQDSSIYLQDMISSKGQLALTKQIPGLVKTVHSFSLRVKMMLGLNGCDSAFISNLHSSRRKEATNDLIKKKKKEPKETKTKRKRGKNKNNEDEDKENDETQIDEETNDVTEVHDDEEEADEDEDEEHEEEDDE